MLQCYINNYNTYYIYSSKFFLFKNKFLFNIWWLNVFRLIKNKIYLIKKVQTLIYIVAPYDKLQSTLLLLQSFSSFIFRLSVSNDVGQYLKKNTLLFNHFSNDISYLKISPHEIFVQVVVVFFNFISFLLWHGWIMYNRLFGKYVALNWCDTIKTLNILSSFLIIKVENIFLKF